MKRWDRLLHNTAVSLHAIKCLWFILLFFCWVWICWFSSMEESFFHWFIWDLLLLPFLLNPLSSCTYQLLFGRMFINDLISLTSCSLNLYSIPQSWGNRGKQSDGVCRWQCSGECCYTLENIWFILYIVFFFCKLNICVHIEQ